MQRKTSRVILWVSALFLVGVFVLVFSGGNSTIIALGVMLLPLLLIVQAYVILREPPDNKEYKDDQWYEH